MPAERHLRSAYYESDSRDDRKRGQARLITQIAETGGPIRQRPKPRRL
jgi:hypothetical protein